MNLFYSRLFKLSIAAFLAIGLIAYYKSSPSKPVVDNGHYFRMTVGLTYKGQPVDIDFVAGCGVHVGRDLSGGSIEEPVSMTAFVFGAKMPEGHAVVIRTIPVPERFNPCYGDTTSNGQIPKGWLPLIAWYEHDDDFAHGIGYYTQDAYENPNARFGFRSVVVERATRADFDTYMRDGPRNLLPSYLTDWLTHVDSPVLRSVSDVTDDLKRSPTKAWVYSGRPVCSGVQKIELTPSQREQVRQLEPAGQIGFWAPLGWQAQSDAGFKIITGQQRDYRLQVYRVPYTDMDRFEQMKIYPLDSSDSLARLNVHTGEDGLYIHDVLVGDGRANLGFVYCDVWSPLELEEAVTGRPASMPRRSNSPCRIGDYIVPVNTHNCDQGNWVVFYEDKFAIILLLSVGI